MWDLTLGTRARQVKGRHHRSNQGRRQFGSLQKRSDKMDRGLAGVSAHTQGTTTPFGWRGIVIEIRWCPAHKCNGRGSADSK